MGKNAMTSHPIKSGKHNEQESFNPFIVGSGGGGGKKASTKAAMHHDGIVLGGSITSQKTPVSAESINRLPGRQDGKIL